MQLSQLITVWSVSTSIGRSLTAANLAITLSKKSNNVLLADFDLRNPSVSFYMNSKDTVHGIDNLLAFALGRKVDISVVNSNLQKYGNLFYLKGTANPQQALSIDVSSMQYIIERLRDRFEYIVLDINNEIDNAATFMAMKQADLIITLIEKNTVKIQAYEKIKDIIFNEFDKRKFIPVINKYTESIYMPDQDIEDYMGIQVNHRLPMLGVNLVNHINRGILGQYLDTDKEVQKVYVPKMNEIITAYINSDYANMKNIKSSSTFFSKLFRRAG